MIEKYKEIGGRMQGENGGMGFGKDKVDVNACHSRDFVNIVSTLIVSVL